MASIATQWCSHRVVSLHMGQATVACQSIPSTCAPSLAPCIKNGLVPLSGSASWLCNCTCEYIWSSSSLHVGTSPRGLLCALLVYMVDMYQLCLCPRSFTPLVCARSGGNLNPLNPLLSENMMDMHVQMHELILCLVYLLTQHDGRTHEAASNSYPAPV